LLIAEYVHGVRKVWAADRMMTVTVAGRFLHAQQEQGGVFRVVVQPLDALRCRVASPAQYVAASVVAGAEPLGEAVAAEFRALGKWPVTTVH
jgi:hypothetical protein